MDAIEVLDFSKENILPLRQGRKASHLKTALQAQVDPETQQMLRKKREEYEYMIRIYEGDDPLELYYNYVIWLEQSFPNKGRENNVAQLLEDTLVKFKDIEKYKQDPRFIQLLIKYLNMQLNSLELYQLVYDQGLGTMCASLYKAWAEEYEKMNDIKGADEVYKLGMRCHAQPVTELENAHVQFQLNVARRMIDGTLSPVREESRTTLSKLKLSSVRTSRVSHDSAGTLPSRRADDKKKTSNALRFQIYEEDESNAVLERDLGKTGKFPKGSLNARENVMQAGKWCGQKQKQQCKLSRTPTAPSFYIHEDPEAACFNIKTDYRPRALKLKNDDFNPPVAVFEPPDPTKKPMYPKQLVYVGGRDVQLEEIRAAHYWKKVDGNAIMKKFEVSTTKNESESNSMHVDSSVSARENGDVLERDPLAPQHDCLPPFYHSPSQSMTVNTQAAVNMIERMWTSPLAQDAEKVDYPLRQAFNEQTFSVHRDTSSAPLTNENKSRPFSAFQAYADDLASPMDNLFVSPSSRPKMHSQRDFVKTSTFDVFCDENPSTREDPFEAYSKISNNEANAPTFPIFCDNPIIECPTEFDSKTSNRNLWSGSQSISCSRSFNNFNSSSIPEDRCGPILHSVFTRMKNDFHNSEDRQEEFDHSAGLRPALGGNDSANTANVPLPLIIPVNLEDTPLESENKENHPPSGYKSPNDCRPLSGILTPCTRIQFDEQPSDDSFSDSCKSEDFHELT